ncbi:MAG: hypothetical protein RDV48_30860 [Candidatus Eremiobacteraeota bacterium]|nr:hypothetical protein [Candidatus Eremiobacteraeota bacterium]
MVNVIILVILIGLFISLPFLAISSLARKKWKKALILLGIFLVLFLGIALPHFIHVRHCGQYVACSSNLHSIALSLEKFAEAHEGRYPSSLEELKPDKIREIPTCPSARKDTYSKGYLTSADSMTYTIYCSGDYHKFFLKSHHANHRNGYPQYDSIKGFIEER